MCKKLKNLFFTGFQGVTIAVVIILLVCPLSCKLTAEGIDIIKGDYTSPKMSECLVLDDKHLELDFSEKVDVSCINISKKNENNLIESEDVIPFHIDDNNNGKIIIGLDNSTEIGFSYIINGVVEDNVGNSLTFSAPFSGYNGNIPKMIITEVHPVYAKGSRNKISVYRCEYVELLALEDGNLYGLVLGSATNGPELDYYFPAIEVKKGEIILVHFNAKGDGCISEEGDDLNLATSEFCLPGIRDLWIGKEGSAFSDSYDAVYLKDSINNKFVDGFMYYDKAKTGWTDEISSKINEMVSAGIFVSGEIGAACKKDTNSALKAFVRKNISDILMAAENSIEKGEEIVIPPFSKDNWSLISADAGKI